MMTTTAMIIIIILRRHYLFWNSTWLWRRRFYWEMFIVFGRNEVCAMRDIGLGINGGGGGSVNNWIGTSE